jgi:hypothetical protein
VLQSGSPTVVAQTTVPGEESQMSASKLRVGAVLTLAALATCASFASSALALPTQTSPCSGCHGGPDVPITTTLAAWDNTTATYNVSALGGYAIAVFDGKSKVAAVNGAGGSFSVPVGRTYTVFAVVGPTTSGGLGSTSLSPAAPAVTPPVTPPADTTAPTTISNVAASYTSLAVITLTATDSGSGVAATYYKVDGGAQSAGTSITVAAAGPHTLEFWSVDAAGNVETHKTANFAITATLPVPTPVPTPTPAATATTGAATSTVTIYASAWAHHVRARILLSGRLTPGAGGETVQVFAMTPGSSTWTLISSTKTHRDARADDRDRGSCKRSRKPTTASWLLGYRLAAKGTYKFQVRFAGSSTAAPTTSRTVIVKAR